MTHKTNMMKEDLLDLYRALTEAKNDVEDYDRQYDGLFSRKCSLELEMKKAVEESNYASCRSKEAVERCEELMLKITNLEKQLKEEQSE